MAEIIVDTVSSSSGGWIFQVSIRDGGQETKHKVRMSKDYYQRLSQEKIPPEEFVKRSFQFLLERESKESIMGEFDMPKIAFYFSEYEGEIVKRLS